MLGKKDKKAMRKGSVPDKGDIKAFLGPGSQFEGKLVFNEIVRLDGTFRGEILSNDTLIVGETADLQAEINVGTLLLSGNFKGNIVAKNKVELRAPARVEGHIATPSLAVEEGVLFNGSLAMTGEASPEDSA